MTIRLGSLCTGYGGLDLAMEQVFPDSELVWVCDSDPDVAKVLAARFPSVPNLNDLKTTNWATVPSVDILTGGYPCQPFSAAGKRQGSDDPRHLWPYVREALRCLRPRLTLLENVAGHRTLGFPEVLADLAEDGFSARWISVRASDAGAPHRRERLFFLVYQQPGGDAYLDRWVAANAGGDGCQGCAERDSEPLEAEPVESFRGDVDRRDLLPTPAARDGKGRSLKRDGGPALTDAMDLLPTPCAQQSGNSPEEHLRKKPGRTQVTDLAIIAENDLFATGGKLLPTPKATDGTKGGPNQRGSKGDLTLPSAAVQLLPTPSVADGTGGHRTRSGGSSNELLLPGIAIQLLPTPRTSDANGGGVHGDGGLDLRTTVLHSDPERWGQYAPAIARWELILGRTAPEPTIPGRNGKPVLSPRFTEFLMGLPDGWVTDVPGLSKSALLRILGNGVVPQQGEMALRLLLAETWTEAVA